MRGVRQTGMWHEACARTMEHTTTTTTTNCNFLTSMASYMLRACSDEAPRQGTTQLLRPRIVAMVHPAKDRQASLDLAPPNLDTGARQVGDVQGGRMESISAGYGSGRLGLAMFFERIMPESRLAFGTPCRTRFARASPGWWESSSSCAQEQTPGWGQPTLSPRPSPRCLELGKTWILHHLMMARQVWLVGAVFIVPPYLHDSVQGGYHGGQGGAGGFLQSSLFPSCPRVALVALWWIHRA